MEAAGFKQYIWISRFANQELRYTRSGIEKLC